MSIIYVILISIVSIAIIGIVRDKLTKWFIALIMFVLTVPFVISIFNPFELYEVAFEVYFIAFLGYLCFFFGFFFPKQKNNYNSQDSIVDKIDILISKKSFLLIYLISLLVLMSLAITQWALISLQNGMGNLKLEVFELIFNGNSFLYFYYQVLLVPLFHLSCMALSVLVVNNRFNKQLVLFLVFALAFSYIGGKRGYFAIMLEYLVLAFVLNKYSSFGIKRVRRKIPIVKLAILGSIVFVGAALMTTVGHAGTAVDKDNLKSGMLENAENFVKYQIGPYRALDYALSHNYIERYGGYTYGRATLGGMIDYYGCGLLSRLGIPTTQVRVLTMLPLQDNSVPIGKNTSWNYSFTSFYYFMFDFGLIGVVFFSFLFGVCVRYSLILFQKKRTIASMTLVGFLFISCCNFNGSWFNVELYAQPAILLFLYLSKYEKNTFMKATANTDNN